jgi:hypothetical protein
MPRRSNAWTPTLGAPRGSGGGPPPAPSPPAWTRSTGWLRRLLPREVTPRRAQGRPRPTTREPSPGALYDMLAPQLVDAVAAGVRRGQRPEIASVGVIGVARVVDALRAASESASDLPDGAARARLAVAVSDAIAMLTVGPDAAFRDGPHGGALAAALDGRQPSPSPPPTPRPAGRRRARAGAEP